MSKNINDVWLLRGNVFIKDLKYSINDEVFYYNVLTKGGDELVYKYSKEEHEDIELEKEGYVWRRV